MFPKLYETHREAVRDFIQTCVDNKIDATQHGILLAAGGGAKVDGINHDAYDNLVKVIQESGLDRLIKEMTSPRPPNTFRVFVIDMRPESVHLGVVDVGIHRTEEVSS